MFTNNSIVNNLIAHKVTQILQGGTMSKEVGDCEEGGGMTSQGWGLTSIVLCPLLSYLNWKPWWVEIIRIKANSVLTSLLQLSLVNTF